jgi:hypothetical protein
MGYTHPNACEDQMRPQRLKTIKTLLRLLEPFEEELRDVLLDEEENYEARTELSQSTSAGIASEDAVHLLSEANERFGDSLERLRELVAKSESREILDIH